MSAAVWWIPSKGHAYIIMFTCFCCWCGSINERAKTSRIGSFNSSIDSAAAGKQDKRTTAAARLLRMAHSTSPLRFSRAACCFVMTRLCLCSPKCGRWKCIYLDLCLAAAATHALKTNSRSMQSPCLLYAERVSESIMTHFNTSALFAKSNSITLRWYITSSKM